MAEMFDLKRCPEAFNLKVGESADLSPNKDKGIVKKMLTQGKGGEYPNEGDKVFYKYTAYLGDKMIKEYIFDSTEKDGKPFEYECLKGKVIRGFELAVLTMKPGERSLIFIKPEYGFGKSVPPSVPLDTDILFDIEIIKRYLKHWKTGEEARVFFAARQAFGQEGCEKYDIGPNKDLTFWINMKQIERVKEYWEMDYKEKMDKSVEYKEIGEKHFKGGEYELATTIYEKMLEYVQDDLEGEDEERRRDLVVFGNLRLAKAYLKVEKNSKARDCCDKALTFDENNLKAYLRRGMANFADGEYETAKKDFQKVLEIEPQNKPAKDQIDKCIIKMDEKANSDIELARKMMSSIGKQVTG
ncbi:FKBP4-like protein [Mya arenaria]|uniref:peptidylprolyl isomerase n=1 Tax=Mya arenaria TaxID=6604 RepID=A0ABY7DZS9_MYAAR|nr:FKBP4-like protein [Mya arenaria]